MNGPEQAAYDGEIDGLNQRVQELEQHLTATRTALEPFARMYRWTNLPSRADEAQVFWRKNWLTGQPMKLTTDHFRIAAVAFYHRGVLPTDIGDVEEILAKAIEEEIQRHD